MFFFSSLTEASPTKHQGLKKPHCYHRCCSQKHLADTAFNVPPPQSFSLQADVNSLATVEAADAQ